MILICMKLYDESKYFFKKATFKREDINFYDASKKLIMNYSF